MAESRGEVWALVEPDPGTATLNLKLMVDVNDLRVGQFEVWLSAPVARRLAEQLQSEASYLEKREILKRDGTL